MEERLFGTDGVRGLANRDLSPELALRLGRAAALVSCEKKPGRIVVGRDTRLSGDLIENAMVAGILSAGVDVLRIGIMPTPAAAYLTRAMKADAGIVISASHNPIEDNGIKFFDSSGFKLESDSETHIEKLVREDKWGLGETIGVNVGRVYYVGSEARRVYIEHVLGVIQGDLSGLRIAIDCAYGAAWDIGPSVFMQAGAEIIPYNNEPLGEQINVDCGSTNPEFLKSVMAENPDAFGLSFDGDADRVIAVDEDGKYLDGDVIMAIAANDMHTEKRLKGGQVVVTVMTNYGFDLAMKDRGIRVVKTDVGDRFVLQKMREEGANLGGEQSGHILFLDHNTTGDGIITGLKLAEIVKKRGGRLAPLTEVMRRLPQILVNVNVKDKKKLEASEQVRRKVEAAEEDLTGHGRVLIRPSGTEPLVRVMVEAEDEEDARAKADDLAEIVKQELG